MKKSIIFLISILCANFASFSQNQVDALRYSQTFYGGTARSTGIGGAFGALGGDISSLSYNPAGIGIYKGSEFTFSPGFYFNSTSAKFNNSTNNDFQYNLNLNNIGIIATYKADTNKGWISTSFGFGYNRMNNYNQNIDIEGINNSGSMTDLFAAYANGVSPDKLDAFNEGLAYNTNLIKLSDSTNNLYQSILPSYGELQRKTISTYGSHGEYIFTLGTNYNNELYLGAAFGIQSVNYSENSEYSEMNINNASTQDFQKFIFKQNLNTKGNGYNFKFGAIIRPVDYLRIGLAIHSPTIFYLTDNYSSSISSEFKNSSKSSISDSPDGRFNYELTTPYKVVGSLGFVVKKFALIGLECEYVDYSLARLRSNDWDFHTENNSIQTSYRPTENIRAGFEYRFGPFSVRGGYGFYGSPYKTDQLNKNAFTSKYSAGFGIKNKNASFDFSYIYSASEQKYYLYDPYVVSINPSFLTNNSSEFIVTLGFKF
jgi:hypothetical protein